MAFCAVDTDWRFCRVRGGTSIGALRASRRFAIRLSCLIVVRDSDSTRGARGIDGNLSRNVSILPCWTRIAICRTPNLIGVPPLRTARACLDINRAVAWEICPSRTRFARNVGEMEEGALGARLRAETRGVVRSVGDQPRVTCLTPRLPILILVVSLALAHGALACPRI